MSDGEENKVEAEKSGSAAAEKAMAEMAKKDWMRILYVLILCVFLYFEVVWAAMILVALQVLVYLVKGEPNEKLSGFADKLAGVIGETVDYVLFRTSDKPWPFKSSAEAEEPSAEPAAEASEEESK
ncbi:MAG TPA: hypothetical protein DCP57_08645 [Gammaproteobacteria bacterium]|jgi:hypothetical protein|nr:MAG: DUF4389 domain-containing protein [OM182 bacterium]HAL42498.1 hypothetical protein [Gammaproteobacteria bacterium]HBK19657.1 hypothetical protein [Gammaproteobacteria bacterium]|tara:strand:- start:591 stop:968 length:378 start_codon:yes stop_codon:yes gene_type:complete